MKLENVVGQDNEKIREAIKNLPDKTIYPTETSGRAIPPIIGNPFDIQLEMDMGVTVGIPEGATNVQLKLNHIYPNVLFTYEGIIYFVTHKN